MSSQIEATPGTGTGATPGAEGLPYLAGLVEAGRYGRVLHRNDIYGSGPAVDEVHGELLDFVVKVAGAKVLDIGCGIAPYVSALRQRGFESVGVEIEQGLARAAHDLGREVLLMDARSMAFRDGCFDTCLLIEVVEHIDDFESVLREAGRIARRNIVISVPNIEVIPFLSPYHVVPWHLLEATHVNFFTPAILETLLRRIFPERLIEVEAYSPFFPYVTERVFNFQIRAVVSLESRGPLG